MAGPLDEAVRLRLLQVQGPERRVSFRHELVRLAVHGTLHVLGHDHPEDDERDTSPMFRLQETLVRGILDPRDPPGAAPAAPTRVP